MSYRMNLKLKDGVEPSVLVKYGFAPKYDENTGQIKKYEKEILISVEKITYRKDIILPLRCIQTIADFFVEFFTIKLGCLVFSGAFMPQRNNAITL